jgi:hypothetical protein
MGVSDTGKKRMDRPRMRGIQKLPVAISIDENATIKTPFSI